MLIHLRPGVRGVELHALIARLDRLLPGSEVRAKTGAVVVMTNKLELLGERLPRIENLPGVARAELALEEACPLVTRAAPPDIPAFVKGGARRGFILIAGPCAVEGEASYLADARALKAIGVSALRAGVYKPRTSPYSFQGLGEEAYPIVREARRVTGLPVVTEVVSERQLEKLAGVCDMLQIGARNMRNYELLKAAAAVGLPVLLKRAPGAALKEWLLCAEYLLRYGDGSVILCERGDSYAKSGARGLNLEMIRQAVAATDLPVIADPSHASGARERVAAQAMAAVKAGAGGLMVETCVDPESALVDGRQTLALEDFSALAARIRPARRDRRLLRGTTADRRRNGGRRRPAR